MITGLYAALLALFQIFLTLRVVRLRWSRRVALGDGEDKELTREIRAHGNFVETVPMALLLILIAEFSGAPSSCVHALGAILLVSRASHFIGITTGNSAGKCRMYGMIGTLLVLLLGAVLNIWLIFLHNSNLH